MKPAVPDFINIYFCGREKCLPGHFFGPGVRPHYLIHFVLSGEGIFRYKNNTFHLKEGDAFLISPMESVFYQADNENPWEYAWVGFDGQNAEEIMEQTCFSQACISSCPPEEISYLKEHVLDMLRVFSENKYDSLYLLGEFLQILSIMSDHSALPDENSSRQYMNQALEYIHNNYSYQIRIRDIAAAIGIDRTYLYRIFMEQEHISPKQYLLKLRIRTAVNMLTSTDYTVTEIAYSCGFTDAAAFSSQFKKSTGHSPKDFRELMILEKNSFSCIPSENKLQ